MERMTKDVRALELYELAQSVLDTKGRFVGVGGPGSQRIPPRASEHPLLAERGPY